MNSTQTKETNKRPVLRRTLLVLTPDLVRRLDIEARRRTASRSFLVRQACEAFLKGKGGDD